MTTDPAAPTTGTAPPAAPPVPGDQAPTGTLTPEQLASVEAPKAAAAGIWPKTGALSREDALAKITKIPNGGLNISAAPMPRPRRSWWTS